MRENEGENTLQHCFCCSFSNFLLFRFLLYGKILNSRIQIYFLLFCYSEFFFIVKY